MYDHISDDGEDNPIMSSEPCTPEELEFMDAAVAAFAAEEYDVDKYSLAVRNVAVMFRKGECIDTIRKEVLRIADAWCFYKKVRKS